MNEPFWRDKKVLVTGHTGFKGSWLSLWLQELKSKVYGYSLDPPTEPNMFNVACIKDGMELSIINDISDFKSISDTLQLVNPDIVLHLAAQPIVRYSYLHPLETYAVNVTGTLNLLEAIRNTPSVRAVVIVTTDKCYENQEMIRAYHENDPLGGYDPYSSSKACVEIITNAWRRSFLNDLSVHVATARAGNVIGGGDWATDRLIPDILRAIDSGTSLEIRSPEAIRPWQHVLEPLSGYLSLAERLFTEGSEFGEAWNFGPSEEDAHSVRWILDQVKTFFPDIKWECTQKPQPHEASYLQLDSSKACSRLNWNRKWQLDIALRKTIEWHSAWRQGKDMREISLTQINEYVSWDLNDK